MNLKVKEAARELGVSETTLRRQIRSGLVKARRDRFTRRVFVPREEVERRIAEMDDWTPGQSPPPRPEPDQEEPDLPTKINIKTDATPAHPRSSSTEPVPEADPDPTPPPETEPAPEPAPAPTPEPVAKPKETKEVKRRDFLDDLGDW